MRTFFVDGIVPLFGIIIYYIVASFAVLFLCEVPGIASGCSLLADQVVLSALSYHLAGWIAVIAAAACFSFAFAWVTANLVTKYKRAIGWAAGLIPAAFLAAVHTSIFYGPVLRPDPVAMSSAHIESPFNMVIALCLMIVFYFFGWWGAKKGAQIDNFVTVLAHS